MKQLACLVLTLALSGTINALFAADVPPANTPSGRIELFNGKDFSGWTFCLQSNAAPAETWTVTNGVMHCTGRPYGYVRTEQAWRDYKLTVEWRFVRVGPKADNTGIFLHVQPPDRVWPKCIEAQGQYQHQGDLILMGGATCQGHDTPQSRNVRMRGAMNEKPAGEWNTYEIVCAADALKVSVNGRLLNEAAACSVTAGAIALQSEGGEYEVRKVFLEPLKP
jgi:hypothetical protein